MASMMIALDPTTAENGCLKVLRGSHKLGRIDHKLLEGEQVGADLMRVEQAQNHLETKLVEMAPGDALFFHCNTLHRSDQNRSDQRRWTLLCCFNAARDDPYIAHHHPGYTKLEKVGDDAIKRAGLKFATSEDHSSFMETAVAPAELSD
ncbi:phytanoyl-CoA dioxygenase family protein [Pelagibius sp. Alg239-R121]|uniref:phytanoyl-CoA dioxygenase family protein n=1 Tax=Pelagibius sp. Alg239-R121 TaxID=2993448 RepID=UPI0024A68C1B|nr:phytanoyl-CoA dioxygenase family protein [Pelagibius sp. Alg239-R121]